MNIYYPSRIEVNAKIYFQIFNPQRQKGVVDKSAAKVKEGPVFYDPPPFCYLELKDKLRTSHLKVIIYAPEHLLFSYYHLSKGLKKVASCSTQFDASLLRLQEMEEGNCQDTENKCEAYQKRLSRDYNDILHCLDSLGLICAHLVFPSITITTTSVVIIATI